MITPSAPMPSVSRATCWISSSSAVLPSPTSMPSSRARPDAALVEIDADHTAAVRAQELHGQLAEDPEADDDERLAERRDGPADALEGDRAQASPCSPPGIPGSSGIGHRQVARNANDLGVVRGLRAGARNAIADLEISHPLADLDHGAGRRVPGRLASRELALHHVSRSTDPLLLSRRRTHA